MELQQRVLHKADELFRTYGIRSVTMDDIAKALGISKKTLYQSYSEKDHRTPEKESDGLSGEDCEKSRATRPNIELETRTW